MYGIPILRSQFVLATAAALAAASPAFAGIAPKVSDPFVHERLAVYFIHGPSTQGPVPLTLGEAMAKGLVTVHETGSVNRTRHREHRRPRRCSCRLATSSKAASRTAR